MHVDDYIWENRKGDSYAQWVLMHFRLSATMQGKFQEFMKDEKLSCDYNNGTYRVIGASRMGDIWLTSDFKRVNGYDLRVDIEDCSNFNKFI